MLTPLFLLSFLLFWGEGGRGVWHLGSLSSLTRDPSCAPCSGSAECQPLDLQENSPPPTFDLSFPAALRKLCGEESGKKNVTAAASMIHSIGPRMITGLFLFPRW